MAALLGLLLIAALGFGLGWLVRSSGRRVIDIELPEEASNRAAEPAKEREAASEISDK